jgi:hypothetical protein
MMSPNGLFRGHSGSFNLVDDPHHLLVPHSGRNSGRPVCTKHGNGFQETKVICEFDVATMENALKMSGYTNKSFQRFLKWHFLRKDDVILEVLRINPLRTEVYFYHQNQNAKNIGNFTTLLKPHKHWYSFERYRDKLSGGTIIF